MKATHEMKVTHEAPAPEPRVPAAGVAFRRILWACDFSACSRRALRWLIPLAKAYGSEIAALHVMPTSQPARGGPLSLTNPALLRPHLHHDVSAALDRYLEGASEAVLGTRVVLREGNPAQEILAAAEAMDADLIALGTHGRGPFERSLIGSVAEAVLGRARCPVLVVPTGASPTTGSTLPRVVLWATDFSRDATRALAYAQSIRARSAADLVLVHVVAAEAMDADRERAHEAERRLREIGYPLPGHGVERIVAVGRPPSEILRIARERKAGLVVMGAQGPRALRSILFGSTSRRVVRDAPCPVLTVRAG
jgi:nucleotide-binding universal stress UspA family protein